MRTQVVIIGSGPSGLLFGQLLTVAGIDNVMALRPPSMDIGMNVTIVQQNVDHLEPLTELAIAKGFKKINFQFTTPFGRAWESVVPPLEVSVAENGVPAVRAGRLAGATVIAEVGAEIVTLTVMKSLLSSSTTKVSVPPPAGVVPPWL